MITMWEKNVHSGDLNVHCSKQNFLQKIIPALDFECKLLEKSHVERVALRQFIDITFTTES